MHVYACAYIWTPFITDDNVRAEHKWTETVMNLLSTFSENRFIMTDLLQIYTWDRSNKKAVP